MPKSNGSEVFSDVALDVARGVVALHENEVVKQKLRELKEKDNGQVEPHAGQRE